MAELIDRKELRKFPIRIDHYDKENGSLDFVLGIETVFEYIEYLPTIEAKPVVYCKDCKYNVANRQQDPLDITDYTDITCDYFMTDRMSPNDYCSQGVKIPVISMEDVPKIMEEMEK